MKELFLLCLIFLVLSCNKKKEPVSPLKGNWELVKIEVKNYSSNDYTGDWNKLDINFNGDTLIYNSATGINFYDTTSYNHKEILYKLNLSIDEDIIVNCNLTDIESGISKDTTFKTSFTEGDFDFTFGGGGKYDIEIEFGENNFYIYSLSQTNILYAIKDEIVNDTLVLKDYHRDYQPTSFYADYNYFFCSISN